MRQVGMTKKAPGTAPTLTEIRAFMRKHCGLKSAEVLKMKKHNVAHMFTIHPQRHLGVVNGKVKVEKRKLANLPKPPAKKRKISVKVETD